MGYDRYYIILAFVGCIVLFCAFIWFEKKASSQSWTSLCLKLVVYNQYRLRTYPVLCDERHQYHSAVLYRGCAENRPRADWPYHDELPHCNGDYVSLSGYISDKVGAAKITLVGLVVMTAGLYLLSTMTAAEPVAKLILFLCIVGFGAGVFSAPNTSLIMSTAPAGNSASPAVSTPLRATSAA